jgi:hypothetical protein
MASRHGSPAGVTPVVVPSSTSGGQAKAVTELFDAFA